MILRDSAHVLLRIGCLAAAVLAGSGVPVRAQEPSEAAGTMPEDYLPQLRVLLRAALKQSPQMILSQINIASNEAQVLMSNSQMIPHVGANANYGITTTQIVESTTQSGITTSNTTPATTGKGFFYSVNASETLFQWGQLFNRSRMSRIGLSISKRQYDDAYRNLALQIRESYLGLIVAKINLRNVRYSQQLSEEALAAAQDQARNGEISPSGIASQELQTDASRLQADRAEEAYVHARHSLAALAGLSDIADSGIPVEVPKVGFAQPVARDLLADFMRDGARSTFQAQVMEMQIEQQKLNYKIARVNLLPWISANASYSLENQNSFNQANGSTPSSVTQVGVKSENYGVSVNWNIFDGLSTRGQKRAALAGERSSEQNLANYLDSTLESAQDGEKQVEFTARAMDLSERQLQWQEGGLQQTEGDFRAGITSKSTVEAVRMSAYNQEYAAAAARTDFIRSWIEFVSLVGADPAMQSLPISYVHLARH